jgi:hypothetical protein
MALLIANMESDDAFYTQVYGDDVFEDNDEEFSSQDEGEGSPLRLLRSLSPVAPA